MRSQPPLFCLFREACFLRLWRPQPPLFLVRESYFLFLNVLCDYDGHGLHNSLSANPVFCSSIFYATTASAFPSPCSPFSVPQFFMRLWPLLFLILKACFVFLSFSELDSRFLTPNEVRHRCLNRYITPPQLETL